MYSQRKCILSIQPHQWLQWMPNSEKTWVCWSLTLLRRRKLVTKLRNLIVAKCRQPTFSNQKAKSWVKNEVSWTKAMKKQRGMTFVSKRWSKASAQIVRSCESWDVKTKEDVMSHSECKSIIDMQVRFFYRERMHWLYSVRANTWKKILIGFNFAFWGRAVIDKYFRK